MLHWDCTSYSTEVLTGIPSPVAQVARRSLKFVNRKSHLNCSRSGCEATAPLAAQSQKNSQGQAQDYLP